MTSRFYYFSLNKTRSPSFPVSFRYLFFCLVVFCTKALQIEIWQNILDRSFIYLIAFQKNGQIMKKKKNQYTL